MEHDATSKQAELYADGAKLLGPQANGVTTSCANESEIRHDTLQLVEQTDGTDRHVYKDGGLGWVVVATTGYCFGILIGMINNYALIYNELDRVYNGTEHHILYTAGIGSASVGFQYLMCFAGSILVDLFGARKIGFIGGLISSLGLWSSVYVTNIKVYFLTYSICFGLGQALLITATLAILPHYFSKRLSLANGIMNVIAAGVVVLTSILISLVIENYGLHTMFYFLTALNVLTMFMTLTYKAQIKTDEKVSSPLSASVVSSKQLNNAHKLHRIKKRIKSSVGVEILKNGEFIVWCLSSFIGSFGWLIPIVNIDHHLIQAFPAENPVYANIVFGVASGIAALLFGKIGDMTKFNRIYYHAAAYFVLGASQILIPFTFDFGVFLALIFVLGLMDGVLLCFIVPIAVDLSKIANMARSSQLANHAAGYYHVTIAVSSVAGPAIAGEIYEKYHSYTYAFYFGGSTCLLASILIFVPYCFCFQSKIREEDSTKSKEIQLT